MPLGSTFYVGRDKSLTAVGDMSAALFWTVFNPLPTNDAYMRHGCSHFFHKAMGIYMGDLTLHANTLYVDISHFYNHSYGW